MNIKEIASLASTSVATVSRVINQDARVADTTRQRVLEVIASTGYKPNLVGKALRSHRRGTVLVMLPSISNPYWSRAVEGIEHRAAQSEFDVFECVTNRNYETDIRYLDMIKSGRVDGIILFTIAVGNDELNEYAMRYPIVQCDAGAENITNISFACIDNVAASDEAVTYLLGLGHTRIGLITGFAGWPYELHRQEGYARALARAGIAADKRLVGTSDYSWTATYEACREVMGRPNPPTALFCISDMIAAGAMKYLHENGLTPGRDVDVVGFDGTYLADILTPAVTCVEQPAFEIGKTAFDLLHERINEPGGMCKKVVMPHKFVVKQSTRSKPE